MTDPAVRRKFEALVSAAYADGTLADSERAVLMRKANEWSLSRMETTEILEQGQQRKLSVTIPPTTPERETLLEDLIEVVAADGRVEAPEYHLLARFAETLKISLPDLRARVNRRMQQLPRLAPARETVRTTPHAPPSSSRPTSVTAARRPDPPRPPAPAPTPPAAFEPPQFAASALPPMTAPGPVVAHASFPKDAKVADLPPVTLQLLKQSIMFDNEADSLANITRTLGISPASALDVRNAILAAFPDLKPGSLQVRSPRR